MNPQQDQYGTASSSAPNLCSTGSFMWSCSSRDPHDAIEGTNGPGRCTRGKTKCRLNPDYLNLLCKQLSNWSSTQEETASTTFPEFNELMIYPDIWYEFSRSSMTKYRQYFGMPNAHRDRFDWLSGLFGIILYTRFAYPDWKSRGWALSTTSVMKYTTVGVTVKEAKAIRDIWVKSIQSISPNGLPMTKIDVLKSPVHRNFIKKGLNTLFIILDGRAGLFNDRNKPSYIEGKWSSNLDKNRKLVESASYSGVMKMLNDGQRRSGSKKKNKKNKKKRDRSSSYDSSSSSSSSSDDDDSDDDISDVSSTSDVSSNDSQSDSQSDSDDDGHHSRKKKYKKRSSKLSSFKQKSRSKSKTRQEEYLDSVRGDGFQSQEFKASNSILSYAAKNPELTLPK